MECYEPNSIIPFANNFFLMKARESLYIHIVQHFIQMNFVDFGQRTKKKTMYIIRKNFLANESICINLGYLFACISVDEQRHNRKKEVKRKRFFTILFLYVFMKNFSFKRNKNWQKHWNPFKICRRLIRGKRLQFGCCFFSTWITEEWNASLSSTSFSS